MRSNIFVRLCISPGGGVLLGILGGGVPPGSQNPDLISHPFSDQISKIYTHFETWVLGRNYVIITWI